MIIQLRPSEIFYSQSSISKKFDKNSRHSDTTIGQTLDDILEGRCSVRDIPKVTVMKRPGYGDKYYSVDNRRLWVMKHLERIGMSTDIDVILVNYSFKHSRKFSSVDDGVSVKIRNGGDPGGQCYKLPDLCYERLLKKESMQGHSSTKHHSYRADLSPTNLTSQYVTHNTENATFKGSNVLAENRSSTARHHVASKKQVPDNNIQSEDLIDSRWGLGSNSKQRHSELSKNVVNTSDEKDQLHEMHNKFQDKSIKSKYQHLYETTKTKYNRALENQPRNVRDISQETIPTCVNAKPKGMLLSYVHDTDAESYTKAAYDRRPEKHIERVYKQDTKKHTRTAHQPDIERHTRTVYEPDTEIRTETASVQDVQKHNSYTHDRDLEKHDRHEYVPATVFTQIKPYEWSGDIPREMRQSKSGSARSYVVAGSTQVGHQSSPYIRSEENYAYHTSNVMNKIGELYGNYKYQDKTLHENDTAVQASKQTSTIHTTSLCTQSSVKTKHSKITRREQNPSLTTSCKPSMSKYHEERTKNATPIFSNEAATHYQTAHTRSKITWSDSSSSDELAVHHGTSVTARVKKYVTNLNYNYQEERTKKATPLVSNEAVTQYQTVHTRSKITRSDSSSSDESIVNHGRSVTSPAKKYVTYPKLDIQPQYLASIQQLPDKRIQSSKQRKELASLRLQFEELQAQLSCSKESDDEYRKPINPRQAWS